MSLQEAFNGAVLEPLDDEGIHKAGQALVGELGGNAVLLGSKADLVHEDSACIQVAGENGAVHAESRNQGRP